MIAALLGLAIGIALAILAPGYIPKEYTTLFTVALMAGLDTAFGGLRAHLEGSYDDTVFITGFMVNIAMSVIFCYVGFLLDIDFYFIVILVLGMRVFQNIAIIRRLYLKK